VDRVVSDHACCAREMKVASDRPDDIWLARSGFGGTEYLLSGVFSEGQRRGMAYSHMAEVLAWNPAQRFGLSHKGDIAVGYDADLALRVAPTTARAWWARPVVGTSTGRRSADVDVVR
jgi:allantoinase